MKPLQLKDIVLKIGGVVLSGNDNFIVKNVTTKPYGIYDNTLYFHFNKSRKIKADVLNNLSSVAIITENPWIFKEIFNKTTIVKVPDIKKAYWRFVDYYRNLFPIPIVAITGTCGKTTTREMIKHILRRKYNVKGTVKNRNSAYNSLSYLLDIDERTEAGVYEAAVNSPGNLSYTVRHFKPQIRILLNIGVYHLKHCKTPEAYVKAKSEILHGMKDDDILILNADDERIKTIDISRAKKIIYFGYDQSSDFRIKAADYYKNGIKFSFYYRNQIYQGFIKGLGKHNVYNALASIAAVSSLGISIPDALSALKSFNPVEHRLQLRKGPKGSIIIDDNYNNTPPALKAALEVLKDIAGKKKKIAILGYMYNLGTSQYAMEQYAEMGKKAVEVGVDLIVVVGSIPVDIGKKALELGMDKDKVIFIPKGRYVRNFILPYLNENTIVLLKAPENHVNL
ncbi:Mur ligase [Fervidicella metallireducens AeB]|uniref:Mur ligase n=1 Tax=Fervidicella metallireducens AeB TaxID=1403537 RepID=A0A017RYH4_9CLOT|nr:UDP-N-acetylmuramoyl-tripeptide--D-alanyl-D-alanine ligase [Fervidicella metallireducens]EYE89454.1 Mur ligase [Fervidicella metallireducens AeB]